LRRVADPSIRELADKVDDLSRLVARQSGALGQLADPGRRPGTDLALLVDLHALRGDALVAARATRSGKERAAFEAIATGLERLLAGRGGVLVVPRAGHPFSAATMEAAEEVACADASLDRTVAALLTPGLDADGRTVRPARVAVHRYAAQPPAAPVAADPVAADPVAVEPMAREPDPSTTPEPEPPAPERNGHAPVNGQKTARGRRPHAAAPEPEPVRRARDPQPTATNSEVGTGAGTKEPAPARKSPAKRAARRQPAGKAQPTSAMTSSDTSKLA
jgi:molecular chaperone GrpE